MFAHTAESGAQQLTNCSRLRCGFQPNAAQEKRKGEESGNPRRRHSHYSDITEVPIRPCLHGAQRSADPEMPTLLPSLLFFSLLRASIVLCGKGGCARPQAGALPYWCGACTRPLLLHTHAHDCNTAISPVGGITYQGVHSENLLPL